MKKGDLKLYHKIFIGLILGCIVGLILSAMGGKEVGWINSIANFTEFLGNVFIRLIRMSVVPIVFFSISTAVINLKDIKRLKSIGIRTMVTFIITTACAITIGLLMATIIKPGAGIDISQLDGEVNVQELPGIYETLLDMIPLNIFESLTKGSMLQIIVFAIFVGAAVMLLGKKGEKVAEALTLGNSVVFKIVDIVILYTPIGVFGLMTNVMATYGTSILGNIFKFLLTDYLAAFTHIAVVYTLLLILVAKVNPIKFYKKSFETWLVAFSTCTSMASLPISMRIAKKKIGVPDETASFVLPLGATANMDGTAIFLGTLVLFAAQAAGVDLTLGQLASLILQATLLSVGCAAVPQVGLLIGITMITTMGLPVEVVALVTGIYRIIDQANTSTNALGDLVVATSIAGYDGTLDRDIFNEEEEIIDAT
ncbi:MAG: dicarboxylate/amino acid:cation symporter, partial [Clostridium sp.]